MRLTKNITIGFEFLYFITTFARRFAILVVGWLEPKNPCQFWSNVPRNTRLLERLINLRRWLTLLKFQSGPDNRSFELDREKPVIPASILRTCSPRTALFYENQNCTAGRTFNRSPYTISAKGKTSPSESNLHTAYCGNDRMERKVKVFSKPGKAEKSVETRCGEYARCRKIFRQKSSNRLDI